ncbi:BT_3987 domain-containing protein [Fodinibius halophilus]|uniref:DUF1735 domain-containing protein n=1 Tax=Fodinibius halophilus TaxID=1736908 RepID=A0A6M1TET0_9BACT|nr:Calx-beta domain-containing protein [Fodinibius halophilus]NGP89254.1 DUF1735 domain-containing protein [Fodinibius halophilus]
MMKDKNIEIMKEHIVYKLFVITLVSLFLTGCLNDLFEQKKLTFEDDPKLEFRPQDDTYSEDEGEIEVLVQLIGSQREKDLSVGFSVNSDTTTAVAGTHYELKTTSPVTIPAGSSSTTVTIDLNGTSLAGGEFKILGLTIDSGGEVEPAENLKSYVLTIEGE